MLVGELPPGRHLMIGVLVADHLEEYARSRIIGIVGRAVMPAVEQPVTAREPEVALEFTFTAVAFETVFFQHRVNRLAVVGTADGINFSPRERRETGRKDGGGKD